MIRAALLSLMLATGAAAAMPRTEIPITAVTLSDRVVRFTIPITVGGVSLTGGLDTGSTGLRVMAPALPGAAEAKGPHSSYRYAGGVTIDGKLTTQPVAIGSATGKVPVQRIDAIGCMAQKPQCAATKLTLAEFGLMGDGLKGEGFPVIVGVSMGQSDAPNPLVALGASRWIVELPRPGDTTPGRLILEPSDAEVAGYTRIGLMPALANRRGGGHDGIAGCLVRTDTQQKLCGPMLLDSGAPGIRISIDGAAAWPQGTPGTLLLSDGKAQQQMGFVTGQRDQASRMIAEPMLPGGVPHVSVGMMPYYRWSVLYDSRANVIGLKPRD